MLKRLTTDNPKDNIQIALNLFYIKDGWTWVRGGGPMPEYCDVSLCDYVRSIAKDYIPDADVPGDDNELSDLMAEWLLEGSDSTEGLIATIYAAGWAFAELRHRLKTYEDTGLEPKICSEYKKFEDEAVGKGVPFSRIVELMEADRTGCLVVLDKPRLPLIWGDANHDTILCPNCERDLMGGFELAPTCETLMFQCPHCGQPIDSTKALTREEAMNTINVNDLYDEDGGDVLEGRMSND